MSLGKPTAVYEYREPNGDVLFRKKRFTTDTKRGKTMRIESRSRDGWHWALGATLYPYDLQALLYNMHLLATARLNRKTAVWNEGESDCETLVQYVDLQRYFPTSHWQGAGGGATPQQAEHFRGWPGRILVVADLDPPGHADALRRLRLLRSVGIPRERLALRVPHAPRDGSPSPSGRDLSDHLRDGYSLRHLVRPDMAEFKAIAATAPEPGTREARYRYDGEEDR